MTLSTFYLNGWQRVGIVLSALWAVGVLIFAWQIETTAASKHNDAFYHCLFAPQSDVDQSKCEAQQQVLENARWRDLRGWLLRALAPIPLAWLLVYLVVWVVCWVRGGFNPA